jgi:2-polyprenyl-3-methyl-5-hydroxy-6-metoxy-1,4-benzoquinol methylase
VKPQVDNRYWVDVDTSRENNAHTYALDMVGFNKRVLELGPAAGHVTRALVRQGCTVTGIEIDPEAAAGIAGVADCIVGDLSDPSVIAKAGEERKFDVVLAGDVLEHLADPLSTLSACRDVLLPGGFIVISLPNVAHADVALSLMRGKFAYRDNGLLDRTHLRFFTVASIGDLLTHAGFLAIETRRVVMPVFSTELKLDRGAFEPAVVEEALRHDEAETYQFVVKAVPDDGDYEISRLAARAIEADDELHRERSKRLVVESQLAALEESLKEARTNVQSATTELAQARQDRGRAVREASVARLERAQARSDAAATGKQLATTRAELATTRAELATTRAELATTRTQLAATNTELATTSTQLAAARTQVAAAQAAADRWRLKSTADARRLEKVMGSRTMRYTAPMRGLYRRFRRPSS